MYKCNWNIIQIKKRTDSEQLVRLGMSFFVAETVVLCWRSVTSCHGGVIQLQRTIREGVTDHCERDQVNADIIIYTGFKFRRFLWCINDSKQTRFTFNNEI